MAPHTLESLPLTALTFGRWSLAETIELLEEPSAGKLHARICEGKSRWLCYLSRTISRLSRSVSADAKLTRVAD